jgi:hypothetical protein
MQHYMGASRNHVKPPVLAEKPPVPTTTIEGRSQSAPRHPSCGKSPQCRQRPSKVAARVRRGTPAMEKAPRVNGDRRRSQPKCAAALQPWKKLPVPTATVEGRSRSAPRHPSHGKSPQCQWRPSKVTAEVRRGTPAMEKAPSTNISLRREEHALASQGVSLSKGQRSARKNKSEPLTWKMVLVSRDIRVHPAVPIHQRHVKREGGGGRIMVEVQRGLSKQTALDLFKSRP